MVWRFGMEGCYRWLYRMQRGLGIIHAYCYRSLRKKLRHVGRGWSRKILTVRETYYMQRDILQRGLENVTRREGYANRGLGYATGDARKGSGMWYKGCVICYKGSGSCCGICYKESGICYMICYMGDWKCNKICDMGT